MESAGLHPLRDLFDAAARQRTVKLTCRRCRHSTSFHAAALWWLFERKGWPDSFADVRQRCMCRNCWQRFGRKVRRPHFELTQEEPRDTSLPLPSDLDWKRELRRRR